MKFLWSFFAVLGFVGILVLYFQLIVGVVIQVPFFAEWIDVKVFAIYLILLAFLTGMFITLAVKGFMSGPSTIDDDFNL